MWIGDVGQGNWEEVDSIPAGDGGRNLGWSCREGSESYNTDQCAILTRYLAPLVTICHPDAVPGCTDGEGAEALIGGYVYRGAAYPAMAGGYLFGDFVTGNLFLAANGVHDVAGRLAGLTSFGETERHEIVAVSYSGRLYALAAR